MARASERTQLREYRRKRDFRQTPEPASSKRASRKGARQRFVVQMHRASHLHFDFRLEAGGTLKSWAVPKGPSLDPADKRLAMQVEDHPLDYAGFEGQIPEGNYGAGEVIVWDNGTYELIEGDDAVKQIAKGSLKFEMHGKKLRGAFALVKMRGRDGQDNAWLLIKERDRYARDAGYRRDDRSVLTKRTLDDVARNPRARRWQSNRPAAKDRTPAKTRTSSRRPAAADDTPVELKRPEKVLFPEDGYTKADLAAYFDAMAQYMLPYLADRPLSIQRFPDGIHGMSFFGKNVPVGAPAWLKTVNVRGAEEGKMTRYIVCDDRRTLRYLANVAAITFHVWTSRLDALDDADFIFFDLDPGERCPLGRLASVALRLRDLLQEIGLSALIKTSGGNGFHVLVPLRAGYAYPLVKAFGELVARQIAEAIPDDVTLERSTARRPGSAVYFDYVQIGRGKTMVAPFTVRARKGAPISMPLTWPEVEKLLGSRARDAHTFFSTWTMRTAPAILNRKGDPWKGSFGKGQSLERAVAASRKRWSG